VRAPDARTIESTLHFGIDYNSVMDTPALPEDVRRFVLTSIPSVPFLEALLLLRAHPAAGWDRYTLARRLYVAERAAETLLADLAAAGMVVRAAGDDGAAAPAYRYGPVDASLAARIDRLADAYARQLVEITVLIHSSLDRKAQRFADAFKWRKDS